ncbi:hypothetical protein HDV05_001456, partial [Chytridiales sp. JEL 0842]
MKSLLLTISTLLLSTLSLHVSAYPRPAPQAPAILSSLQLPSVKLQNGLGPEYPYGSSPISVVRTTRDEKTLTTVPGGTSYLNCSIVVEFAVKNLAFTKEVGVRYTNDSWKTYTEALASFDKVLDQNGYELWSLSIYRGIHSNREPITEYEMAAFVSYDNAPRVWDPNGNYFIFQKATALEPLTMVTDSIVYASSSSINLQGSVRTYAFDKTKDTAAGSVQVRWTTDGWKSFKDTSLEFEAKSQSWKWNIEVGNLAKMPLNVTYAIKYECTQGEFWLNQNYKNYQKSIQPLLAFDGDDNILTSNNQKPLTGLINVNVYYTSDLP